MDGGRCSLRLLALELLCNEVWDGRVPSLGLNALGVKISTSCCSCENGLVVKTLKNWTMGTGDLNETLIQCLTGRKEERGTGMLV